MSKQTGKLDIIIGCMFSGKTSELINRIQKASLVYGDDVLVINHTSDTRYGTEDGLYSHDANFNSSVRCFNLCEIYTNELEPLLKKAKAIFIDEAQFFEDLKLFVHYCVEGLNKWVTICGLDSDYKRRKFGHIIDLIPMADSVLKKKALCLRCKDGTEAMFSKRIVNQNNDGSDSGVVIMVGEAQKYESVCRYHYNN